MQSYVGRAAANRRLAVRNNAPRNLQVDAVSAAAMIYHSSRKSAVTAITIYGV